MTLGSTVHLHVVRKTGRLEAMKAQQDQLGAVYVLNLQTSQEVHCNAA